MGKGKNTEAKQNPVKLLLIGCILVALLVGFYYYVSRKMGVESTRETETITQTQQVLLRNLEAHYPPSPKEVVKYYCDITQCFYNEENEDAQVRELALQIRKLYDRELVANQTEEEYIQNLISDIASMKQNGLVISSYSTSSSTDVEYFSQDGFEWARLYCSFSIRQGSTLINSNEQFLLRLDENGHWKIYGWQLVEE
ncbi:MAG: hypothetical protein MR430_09195 [Lachnospiraceae bacterium]|nr:hypothetical protein [Lachnospiraceae bacterium]